MAKRGWRDLFGLKRASPSKPKGLGKALDSLLDGMARNEQRTVHELQAELISTGLAERKSDEQLMQSWDLLTRREQQVLALACLGKTNRQIAARLNLSAETVGTYIKYILRKLNLHGKADLRVLFSSWDFSEWE